MKTIQAGNIKTFFSNILKDVKNGYEIIISCGKKTRKLGILKGKADLKIHDDFEMNEEKIFKNRKNKWNLNI